MIGTACGAATFFVIAFGLLSRSLVRWLTALIAAVVMLNGLAWLMGGLDRLVISEAPKSLRYRTEYWRSSAEVVRERPWLGVGPGNFRQHYLKYKLPESSEEILDPHNLLLDAWVSGGLLAAVAVIGLVLWGVWTLRGVQSSSASDTANSACSRTVAGAFVIATALVCLQRWAFGGIFDEQMLLVGLGGGIVAGLFAGTKDAGGRSEFAALSGAWLTLTIHLLGAGGMEMPAVVQTWLALLFLKSAIEDAASRGLSVGRRSALGVSFATAVAATAQMWTTTKPVLYCQASSEVAENAILRGNYRGAVQRLQDAINADPLDPEPRRRLAQIQFGKWRESDEPLEFDQATRTQREAIARDPASPHDHRKLGEMYLQKFQKDRDTLAVEEAILGLTTAAVKYPNHAATQAALARAFEAAGEHVNARRAAAKAIELDSLNRQLGHYDRLLPDSDLPELESLAE
jgi:hypothetical protein